MYGTNTRPTNAVVILLDSLNRHMLGCYGGSEFDTPNLDAFAARSTRFDNHFVGSLPCMPARREIFAGRKDFLWRPWGPLEVFDPRLPRVVKAAGLNTGVVTDHYHYWEEQANGYVQGFASTLFIRGHETDFWKLPEPGPVPVYDPDGSGLFDTPWPTDARVRDDGTGCSVEWSSEFEPSGAPEGDATAVIRQVYEAGFENLKRTFGGT